jgi:hypothetical protein
MMIERTIFIIKILYKKKEKIKMIYDEKELEKISDNKKVKKALIIKRIIERSLF